MATSIWTAVLILQELAVLIVIVVILRRPREPRAMLAWILAMLLLPGLGLLLFLVFGEPRKRWHRRRRRRRRKSLAGSLAEQAQALRSVHAKDLSEQLGSGPGRLVRLAERLGAHAATRDNDVHIYHDAEQTFLALQLAIKSAVSHIHMEYYIFQADETGTAIRDLLIAKSREGVEVRVLLDFIGCWRMPRSFVRPMREAGVKVAFAMPVIPWRGRWHVNYRNHRKIAILDGRLGFTGSQNIGDEYRGRLARYGPWRDTHLRITGPGVHHLQEIFAEDWHYTTKEDVVANEYFPLAEGSGDHIVQIVPSGPDRRVHVMHHLLFAAVTAAEKSISVITPYFVPDAAMVLAFQAACYRGVNVRFIVPSCTDHRVVLWAGRSFYEELISAGAEIYEEDHTVLHSKVMVIDQTWAMVGSANMDERSFRLSFEATAVLYSSDLAVELYNDFEALRRTSRCVTRKELANASFIQTLGLGMARIASPLL